MLELIEKHDLDESVFLVDGLPSLHAACRYHSLRFRVIDMDIGTALSVSLEK